MWHWCKLSIDIMSIGLRWRTKKNSQESCLQERLLLNFPCSQRHCIGRKEAGTWWCRSFKGQDNTDPQIDLVVFHGTGFPKQRKTLRTNNWEDSSPFHNSCTLSSSTRRIKFFQTKKKIKSMVSLFNIYIKERERERDLIVCLIYMFTSWT